MKKHYCLFAILLLLGSANAQIINIPDANFKAALLSASSSNQIAAAGLGNYITIDTNGNSEIEVSEALTVTRLKVQSLSISNLTGISYFTNLTQLTCNNNSLISLDVTALVNLDKLYVNNNQLTTLQVSGLANLSTFWCHANQLTTLDLTGLTNLSSLSCMTNQITSLDLQGLNDLQNLSCYGNQLTSLDVSGLQSLTSIECSDNLITSINLSDCPVLQNLTISMNPIAYMDLSTLPASFFQLVCSQTQLTSLDLSNVSLVTLNCSNSPITSLDVSNSEWLYTLDCTGCQLTALDVSQNANLNTLNCGMNQLTTLDVSHNTTLANLNCKNNLLTSLFVKNGASEGIDFNNNPTLQYICADEAQFNYIQTRIAIYQYANCHVNSYCSFVPGGTHYVIQGTGKLDADLNGCDAADTAQLPLGFSITSGSSSGIVMSSSSNSYQIPVMAGTHTITPTFENANYYTIEPASFTVTFPAAANPFETNFCITPNGIHHDVEIIILPVDAAIPGFDQSYKIMYKNKGTTIESGTIDLYFDDTVSDFVSADPDIAGQSGNTLTWNYSGLLPFEQREIAVTLNLNSPTETPAVNIGDPLDCMAVILLNVTDETPSDNESALNQIVVGALDPNDKTCLDGGEISTAQVGDYVHYLIRFENIGTFAAQNVVVKDMIDTAKYDVATLIPLSGSHAFETRITSGNKVEFIFENIQLPFDDANNDGYVAFKIKTKPTLAVGDTFANSASIYFDYNFPIVTNTATTTITALANPDFEFSDYFTLYPNPAKSELNIKANNSIEVKSINIYNLLGQLVFAIPNAQSISSIDVSDLKSGNYFIKIISDKGSSNAKFIKQ